MTVTTEARGQLPPVTVDCNWCECQFLSRARHGQKVRCPRCRHDIRVKRGEMWAAGSPGPGPSPAASSPPLVAEVPPAAAELEDDGQDDEDEDGETCLHDRHGDLILADWTVSGRLVPVHLLPGRRALELAARGYRENASPVPGACRVTETRPVPQDCGLAASDDFGGLHVCYLHYRALTSGMRRPMV